METTSGTRVAGASRQLRLSYLDGLRGYAALIVLCSHLAIMIWPALQATEVPPPNTPDWQLRLVASPLSAFWDGRMAVSVFFVLSGFVLTSACMSRPLSLPAQVGKRYVRLALPILAATLPALLLHPAGLYFNHDLALAIGSSFLDIVTTLGFHASVMGWLQNALWTVPFIDGHSSYNPILWTMTFEWYGSLLVFLISSLLRRRLWRLPVALLLMCVLGEIPGYAYLHLFMVGMALCDLATLQVFPKLKGQRQATNVIGIVLLLFGAYLPRLVTELIDVQGEGFAVLLFIRHLFPSWQGDRWMLSGAMIVLGVLLSPTLQRLLSRPVSIFFGDISFPLYLFHIPLILSLGCWLMLSLLPVLGFTLTVWLTLIVVAILAILVAMLMHYVVEQLTIRFAHHVGSAIEALWSGFSRSRSSIPIDR